MSSSQGANATSASGYAFDFDTVRDASDWTRFLKEGRKYANYKASSTDNKDTEPVWLKYGNQFRLTYSFGHFKCSSCNGNAFNGKVGDETSVG